MVGTLKENLESIRAKIQSEISMGQKSEPKIIAVSKRQTEEKIKLVYSLGITDFAENYIQEAKVKIESLQDLNICWHFIGQLQKKKIKDIVGKFEYIHTLDREDVAQKISDKCLELNLEQKVLIQVNIAGEKNKLGLPREEVLSFIETLKKFPNIILCGLMVFPPLCESDEENLHWFKMGHQLFLSAKKQAGKEFRHLSMGTSQNYPLALREGANMLRIGESLMGARLQ